MQSIPRSGLLAVVVLVILAAPDPAPAQVCPPGFAPTTLFPGLNQPTCAAIAPDGRVFIAQQGGALRVWTPGPGGGPQPTPVYTLSVNTQGERGFIGLALDPDFAANGFVYARISRAQSPVGARVKRITVPRGSNQATPGQRDRAVQHRRIRQHLARRRGHALRTRRQALHRRR